MPSQKKPKSKTDIEWQKFHRSIVKPPPAIKGGGKKTKPLPGQLGLFDLEEAKENSGGHYADKDL